MDIGGGGGEGKATTTQKQEEIARYVLEELAENGAVVPVGLCCRLLETVRRDSPSIQRYQNKIDKKRKEQQF